MCRTGNASKVTETYRLHDLPARWLEPNSAPRVPHRLAVQAKRSQLAMLGEQCCDVSSPMCTGLMTADYPQLERELQGNGALRRTEMGTQIIGKFASKCRIIDN